MQIGSISFNFDSNVVGFFVVVTEQRGVRSAPRRFSLYVFIVYVLDSDMTPSGAT